MDLLKKLSAACALGFTLAGMLLSISQALADGPAKPQPLLEPADAAVPFRKGEQLDYRVGWENFLTAATARLQVAARMPFYGRTAWHFRATARTVDPVRLLYALDDQFDSYTDTVALAGLQYETHRREPGKTEDSMVRMGSEEKPAVGDGPFVRVPTGTRDPLGAFYALRAHDWESNPETRMPVYDGKKLYELRARRADEAEVVRTPAGMYRATKLELRVLERGKMLQATRFRVWLADNAARTPVLIEAELPFGNFRVELAGAR